MANMTSRTDEPDRQKNSAEQTDDALGDKLSHGASDAAEQAVERIQRTRERVEQELSQRRSDLSARIRGLGDALEGASRRIGDDEMVADCLHYVSDKIGSVAEYVESADSARIAGGLRDVARGRPALFFGGAFALGLALGRFAHSSAGSVQPAEGGARELGSGAARPRSPSAAAPNQSAAAPKQPKPAAQPGGSASRVGASASGASGASGSTESSAVRPPAVPDRNHGTREP